MDIKPNNISINQAAQWYARLSAPDCSEAERIAFEKWMAADSGNRQSYAATLRTAKLISNDLSGDARFRALAADALGDIGTANRHGFLRRHSRHAAALFFAIGIMFLTTYVNQVTTSPTSTADYANNQLLQQRIQLNDGSIVYLDVGAEISVIMSQQERRIELSRGRAYFEVAHDKSRPFSVAASGTEVVALGTRFQVDILSSQFVNVTLAEGSVAVSQKDNREQWRDILKPGEQLAINKVSGQRVTQEVNANEVTSWSSGILAFDQMPLDEVLGEINRYAKVKVVLGDRSLADIPIGGNFVAGSDSKEFVETLAAVIPLRSVRTGANEIVLFHLHETPSQ